MTDNQTAELLCKLLEEHGIAWKKRRGYIRWSKQTKYGVTHYQAWPCFDGTITLTVRDEYGLTPEQAIAATLGEQRGDAKMSELKYTGSEVIAAWNSRAERTCKQEERGWGTEGDHARVWLTCGHDCMVPTVQDLPNYCPNCGARVVE